MNFTVNHGKKYIILITVILLVGGFYLIKPFNLPNKPNSTSAFQNLEGYSATMETSVAGVSSKAQVMVKGNCLRVEVVGGRNSSTMIADYNNDKLLLLVPSLRKYKELSIDDMNDSVPQFFNPNIKITKKTIGKEEIDGQSTIKYSVTAPGKGRKKFEGYLWEKESLPGFPYKWEDEKSRITVVWENGKIEDLPQSYFEIPQDYSVLTSEDLIEADPSTGYFSDGD